jgi:CheY-like chemotaxis protein
VNTSTGTPHILVVDDDAGQRSLFQAFLQKQGIRVVLAASGEEALVQLHQAAPALSGVRRAHAWHLRT